MGIEPTLLAWEARVLPLNYTRLVREFYGGTLATAIHSPNSGRITVITVLMVTTVGIVAWDDDEHCLLAAWDPSVLVKQSPKIPTGNASVRPPLKLRNPFSTGHCFLGNSELVSGPCSCYLARIPISRDTANPVFLIFSNFEYPASYCFRASVSRSEVSTSGVLLADS